MAELDIKDMEFKELKLNIIDLISEYSDMGKGYISYLYLFEEEIKALVGLPKAVQRAGLKDIAHKVVTAYERDGYYSSVKRGK